MDATTVWAAPPERFPSLVDAVLPECDARWRKLELALERAGKLPSQRGGTRPGRRGPRASSLVSKLHVEVAELHAKGLSCEAIAKRLDVGKSTVGRALKRAKAASNAPYRHGTTHGYARGRRCEPCSSAKSRSQRAYEERKRQGLTRGARVPEQLQLEVLEVRTAARNAADVREALAAGGAR